MATEEELEQIRAMPSVASVELSHDKHYQTLEVHTQKDALSHGDWKGSLPQYAFTLVTEEDYIWMGNIRTLSSPKIINHPVLHITGTYGSPCIGGENEDDIKDAYKARGWKGAVEQMMIILQTIIPEERDEEDEW